MLGIFARWVTRPLPLIDRPREFVHRNEKPRPRVEVEKAIELGLVWHERVCVCQVKQREFVRGFVRDFVRDGVRDVYISEERSLDVYNLSLYKMKG